MTKMETFPTDADSDVQATLGRALAKLADRDATILSAEANERTIACRLALYLQAELPHWDVDCEYNCWAAIGQRKGPTVVTTNSETTNARTIYPDILIHHRDRREHLAVIEICKSSFTDGRHQDVKKLQLCLAKLGCRHAFYLVVGVGNSIGENRIEPVH